MDQTVNYDLKDLKKLYKENKKSIWYDRLFFYKNERRILCTSISKFFKTLPESEPLFNVNSVDTFFKELSNTASKYALWCDYVSQKEKSYVFTKKELESLRNAFVGYVGGEYFYMNIVMDKSGASLFTRNGSNHDKVKFRYVCPVTIEDYGIDGTCIDSDGQNCVLQIKGYNPYSQEKLGIEVMQKAGYEGVVNQYINPMGKKNIIVCWFGSDDKVSLWLKRNKKLNEQVRFIDKECLERSLGDDKTFWQSVYKDEMLRIKDLEKECK